MGICIRGEDLSQTNQYLTYKHNQPLATKTVLLSATMRIMMQGQ